MTKVFGERLKVALKNAGITQAELASILHRSSGLVSQWVNGRALPNTDDIRRICALIGTSSDYLLGLSDQVSQFIQEEYEGIRWNVDIADYITGEQRTDIEIGIKLFKEIIENNYAFSKLTNLEPFSSYSLQSLYSAFKAAIRSSSLRLTYVPEDNELAHRLTRKFPQLGDKVIVARIPNRNGDYIEGSIIRAELVAFLAATKILPSLSGAKSIGIDCGYTLLRMAEQSVPSLTQFSGTKWTPLIGVRGGDLERQSANYIALTLANRFWNSQALYLPYFEHGSIQYASTIDFLDNNAKEAEFAFVTVNGPRHTSRSGKEYPPSLSFRTSDGVEFGSLRSVYDELAKEGLADEFAGEFMGLMLDKNANLLGSESLQKKNQREIISIKFSLLRQIVFTGRVWVVAAELFKAKAVLMLLNNGLANGLVIDNEIAQYLLDHG